MSTAILVSVEFLLRGSSMGLSSTTSGLMGCRALCESAFWGSECPTSGRCNLNRYPNEQFRANQGRGAFSPLRSRRIFSIKPLGCGLTTRGARLRVHHTLMSSDDLREREDFRQTNNASATKSIELAENHRSDQLCRLGDSSGSTFYCTAIS